jgi:protein arginine kinase
MKLDDLLHNTGEWLRGSGPQSDVVVSSRIRLARNLADFPFTNRASPMQKGEIESLLRERLLSLDNTFRFSYVPVHSLDALNRQFLVERQLISLELANGDGRRGVAFDPQEACSVMVNEEDHLRLQVLRSGLSLEEAWRDIDRLDDLIEQRITYAFSEELGYLTACPTNVGTGMRASVMLHLPALHITSQIEKVFRAIQKLHLAVRGLHGEGSKASGDFYQISNQVTLGKSEAEILREIHVVIAQIVDYERKARSMLLKESRAVVQDRVSRAYSTLRSAVLMSGEETIELLSCIRLGINLNLIEELSISQVNELFLLTQPAHLQKLQGTSLEDYESNMARAEFLRRRLNKN